MQIKYSYVFHPSHPKQETCELFELTEVLDNFQSQPHVEVIIVQFEVTRA